jgi:hypothetical protein
VAGGLPNQVIDQTYWLVHFGAGSLTADPLDRNDMWTVQSAIEEAEPILAAPNVSEAGIDSHWQAVILVAEFAESDPDPLWDFARKWGTSPDPDLRQAVACCLLEHLLEFHFGYLFPKVAAAARQDPLFADTFLGCLEFGQSEEPENRAQFRALRKELGGVYLTAADDPE